MINKHGPRSGTFRIEECSERNIRALRKTSTFPLSKKWTKFHFRDEQSAL